MKQLVIGILILPLYFVLSGCAQDCTQDPYSEQCIGEQGPVVAPVDIIFSLDKMEAHEAFLKNAIQELDNINTKFDSTENQISTKIAFVGNRALSEGVFNPSFLAEVMVSNVLTFPSPLYKAFETLNKNTYVETASPVGILDQSLSVNSGFIRKEANTLFVIATQRDESLLMGDGYEFMQRLSRMVPNQFGILVFSTEKAQKVNRMINSGTANQVFSQRLALETDNVTNITPYLLSAVNKLARTNSVQVVTE